MQVYKFNVPTFGPGVVYDVDVSVRTEQIRFFAESLKTEKLRSYVPQFVQEAEVKQLISLCNSTAMRVTWHSHMRDCTLACCRHCP